MVDSIELSRRLAVALSPPEQQATPLDAVIEASPLESHPVVDPPVSMLHDNSSNASIHTLVDDSPPSHTKDSDDPKLATIELVKDFSRPNIEFVATTDDPRLWSGSRKTSILVVLCAASLAGNLAGSIFFPAIDSLQKDLGANDTLIAASVSLFVLGQGLFPICWAVISELIGRRNAYIASLVIFCGSSAACAVSRSIGQFLAFRVLQSAGSSAVLTLGAATLVEVYYESERGTKLGIFYAVPLLGPGLGPIIGGAMTESGSWPNAFWFLFAFGGACLIGMLFIPETWRKERSIVWAKAVKRSGKTNTELVPKKKLAFNEFSPGATYVSPTPAQLEKGVDPSHNAPSFAALKSVLSRKSIEKRIRVRFQDANPIPAGFDIFSQRQNSLAIASSAILFASQYCISFTSSRAFAAPPYEFSSLIVGVILLVYGIGNVMGSIGGGRLSDRALRLMKEANGGIGQAEMRLKSVVIPMFILPPSLVVYAWLVDQNQSIYAIVVVLFVIGAATIWLFSGTLSYVVDANVGMASMAIASNSLVRGIFAAAASQAADPLIKLIGAGIFYTGFAVIILVGEVLLLVVSKKGERWREAHLVKNFEKETKEAIKMSTLLKRRGSDATMCAQ